MKKIEIKFDAPVSKTKINPHSQLGIGIDFGTSNSSVAVFDGKELIMIPVETTKGNKEIMPTALYISRKGQRSVGTKAIDDYLEGEAGRTVHLVKEQTGEISVTVSGTESSPGSRADDGAITYTAYTHAFTDQGMKGRLFRGLKKWLGASSVERFKIFDESFTMVELISFILSHIKKEMDESVGKPVTHVYMGRPVHYEGGSQEANETALRRMQNAVKKVAIQSSTPYPEPVAASLSYLQSLGSNPKNQTILTFDFGGGTLDLCILKATGGKFEILSVHGIGLGGDEIDRMIYSKKVFPELGYGSSVSLEGGTRSMRFPFHAFENGLLNWQLTCELNRPELRGHIAHAIQFGGEIEKKVTRLKKLIYNNLSYVVFQAVEAAKIELTSEPTARITVPEIDLDVEISREEFEGYLSESLQEVEDSVREVIRKAGITEKEIDVVVCTGGSSKIPVVRDRLSKIVPKEIVEHRTFTSIAAGLAIASYHQYTSPIAG